TKLVRLTGAHHILLLSLHHIISDGWSIGIFVRELASLYEAFLNNHPSQLQDPPLQYKDYPLGQRGQAGELQQQIDYGRTSLGGQLQMLRLPADKPRPAV